MERRVWGSLIAKETRFGVRREEVMNSMIFECHSVFRGDMWYVGWDGV
jgi:hypothetical protein